MVMGGCKNIKACFNASFNDGLRTKQFNTEESTSGRIISMSDFSGWCEIENKNTYTMISDVTFLHNIFCTNTETNNIGISIFGRNEHIKLDNNYFIHKPTRNFEIMANDLINEICFIDNKLSGKIQINKVQESNIDTVVKKLKIGLNDECTTLFDDNINYSSCIGFLLLKLKDCNLLQEIADIAQLFEKNKHTGFPVTQKSKKPKLYCILCYAPRKHLCLMQHLIANKSHFAFLNTELAIEFETSAWEVTSWFSTPAQLLSNKKAREILKITETFSETSALEALFYYCATKITKDTILLLGEHFALSGSNMFDFLLEEADELLELNLLMLFDNIYKDAEFKLTKRYESAEPHEITNLNINSYISHLSRQTFLQLQALVSSTQSQLGEEHFFATDFQYSEKAKNFKELWNFFSKRTKCPVSFNPLFNALGQCTENLKIFDEDCVDPLFFRYLFGAHKEKTKEEQKVELEEIKKFQKKYQLSSDNNPLLTLSKESIEICENHKACLEALGNFNHFGNTVFIDNGFDNSAKKIKTDYYKINSLL
jgi:hypothetical protein